MYRGDTLLAEGASTLACVNKEGQLQALPPELFSEPSK
jgi:acyl-CoA thioesterase FadM